MKTTLTLVTLLVLLTGCATPGFYAVIKRGEPFWLEDRGVNGEINKSAPVVAYIEKYEEGVWVPQSNKDLLNSIQLEFIPTKLKLLAPRARLRIPGDNSKHADTIIELSPELFQQYKGSYGDPVEIQRNFTPEFADKIKRQIDTINSSLGGADAESRRTRSYVFDGFEIQVTPSYLSGSRYVGYAAGVTLTTPYDHFNHWSCSVKNTGIKSVRQVHLIWDILDSQDNVIDTEIVPVINLEPLHPGEARRFKHYSDYGPSRRYRLTLRYE